MSNDHPYREYEKSPIWKVVAQAVDDLAKNGDLIEQTRREYLVGYITRKLVERPLSSKRLRDMRRKIQDVEHTLAELDETIR